MRTGDAIATNVQQSLDELQKLQRDHQLAAAIAPARAQGPALDPHRLRLR